MYHTYTFTQEGSRFNSQHPYITHMFTRDIYAFYISPEIMNNTSSNA